jgi:hypothetical protein
VSVHDPERPIVIEGDLREQAHNRCLHEIATTDDPARAAAWVDVLERLVALASRDGALVRNLMLGPLCQKREATP